MKISRRKILSLAAATTMARPLLHAASTIAPSEQITIGLIGCGSRGFNLIDEFLALPQCRIVAVCDVDDFHHRDRPWGTGPVFGRRPAVQRIAKAYATSKPSGDSRTAVGVQAYSDYRQLIGRRDIDAVIVATPDHWHAKCTFDALQAGKDVYCEKPVTHLFAEGRTIADEVKQRGAVFQTGSQQRSDPLFHRIVEIARNGLLGKIHTVEVGLPPGYAAPMGQTDVMPVRPDLDYEMWCGPAPVLPLMQARHHRWWRGHRAYGGGVLMDWIGHHNDIAQWAIGCERAGLLEVEAVDWKYPETKVYNTPHHYTIRCEYTGGVSSTISSQNEVGLKIIGTDGWVYAKRGKSQASDSRWLADGFRSGDFVIDAPKNHAANFLECILDRSECIAPAEIAHRSITPGHLGYVSQQVGRTLKWDAANETVVDDATADAALKAVEYRMPWTVPAAEGDV